MAKSASSSTDLMTRQEIKTILPKVSDSYIKKAVEGGLTIQGAKEAADIAQNLPVSVHKVIRMKQETDLSNNDLLNIMEAKEEMPQLTIQSLRTLYELCDRDAETFEHARSEFVLPYVVGDATEGASRELACAMMRLLYGLQKHLDQGGSILDFEVKNC